MRNGNGMKIAHLKIFTIEDGLGDAFLQLPEAEADEMLKEVKDMDIPGQMFLEVFEVPKDAFDKDGKPKEIIKKLLERNNHSGMPL